MASIYKRTFIDKKTGERKKTSKWYVEYIDENDQRKRVPGYKERSATLQLAAKLERNVRAKRSGLEDRYTDHQTTPLTAHLAEYRRYLEGKKRTVQHVDMTIHRIQAAFDAMGAVFLADLSENAFSNAISSMRQAEAAPTITGSAKGYAAIAKALGVSLGAVKQWKEWGAPLRPRAVNDLAEIARWRWERMGKGMSAETANHYLRAMRAFVGWLIRDRRIAENPIVGLQVENSDDDRRRVRRSLTTQLIGQLIKATEAAPVDFDLDGQTRALIYLIACYTGLRRDEIGSLQLRSLNFNTEPPTVAVIAKRSKRRREDLLPLHPELSRKLKAWLESHTPSDGPLFPVAGERTADMLRADLSRAGIPFEDDEGRILDFHALRTTFISNMARAGVPLIVAQKLARHSDPKLTANVYSKLEVFDLGAAVGMIPNSEESASAADQVSEARGD